MWTIKDFFAKPSPYAHKLAQLRLGLYGALAAAVKRFPAFAL